VGNLTGSEARVLGALLLLRTGTLKQLSEAAGINRSNIYPMLDSLSGKGLCERLPGKYAVWQCREPREALARLRRAEEARLQETLETIGRGFEEAERMLDGPVPGAVGAPIELVDDAQVAVVYLEALASVEGEVLVLNRGPYPGEVEPSPPVLEALARGVRARALYVSSELDAPDGSLRSCADAYAEAGVELRVGDSLPLSMALMGEKTALLALPNPDASSAVEAHAATIRHEGMVELLSAAFEHLWDHAAPYRAVDSAGTDLRIVAAKAGSAPRAD